MEVVTQHNPNPCLLDVLPEPLQTMYPDCAATALYINVCHTVNLNIRYIRSSVYSLLPTIFLLPWVVYFNSVVHAFERREKDRMIDKMGDQRDALKKSRARNKKLMAAKGLKGSSDPAAASAASVDVTVQK